MGKFIIVVFAICVLVVIWGFFQSSQPTFANPEQSSGGYVNMVQPQKCSWWNSKCDEHNTTTAGNNVANSIANQNNSQARVNDAQQRYIDQLTEKQKIDNANAATDGAASAQGGLWVMCIQPVLYCLGGLALLYIGYEIFSAFFLKTG